MTSYRPQGNRTSFLWNEDEGAPTFLTGFPSCVILRKCPETYFPSAESPLPLHAEVLPSHGHPSPAHAGKRRGRGGRLCVQEWK